MSRLTEDFKRALSALAYANAGEFFSAREKARFLEISEGSERMDVGPGPDSGPDSGPDPSSAAEQPTAAPLYRPFHRQVVLNLGQQLPRTVMKCVIDICRRLEAGLAVISREAPAGAKSLVDPYASDLQVAGIPWQVVSLDGNSVDQITRYLRSHPQALVMVSSDTDDPLRVLVSRNGQVRMPYDLPVPLVIIAQ